MFVHLGYDAMIPVSEIIVILDKRLITESTVTRQMFQQERARHRAFGNLEEAKSLVVTTEGIHFSPLSALTLAHRGEHPVWREEIGW